MTRTRFIRLLRVSGIAILLLAIAGYAAWRSFAYAQGPKIDVFSPINGSTISSSTVEIAGRARRINSLTINGNPLSVDENGNFKQTRIVFDGVNVFTLAVTDQFGRSVQTQIQVVGKLPE